MTNESMDEQRKLKLVSKLNEADHKLKSYQKKKEDSILEKSNMEFLKRYEKEENVHKIEKQFEQRREKIEEKVRQDIARANQIQYVLF